MNPALLKSMLKTFGFDVEEIEGKVKPMAQKAIDTIENIDKRLGVIQGQNALLLACFDEATIKTAKLKVDSELNGTVASHMLAGRSQGTA